MEYICTAELINRGGQLDLRTKEQGIRNVIQDVLAEHSGRLQRCDVVAINQHGLTLSVEQTDDWWHGPFGKKLANEWGMRHFCSPGDSSRMFTWTNFPADVLA